MRRRLAGCGVSQGLDPTGRWGFGFCLLVGQFARAVLLVVSRSRIDLGKKNIKPRVNVSNQSSCCLWYVGEMFLVVSAVQGCVRQASRVDPAVGSCQRLHLILHSLSSLKSRHRRSTINNDHTLPRWV